MARERREAEGGKRQLGLRWLRPLLACAIKSGPSPSRPACEGRSLCTKVLLRESRRGVSANVDFGCCARHCPLHLPQRQRKAARAWSLSGRCQGQRTGRATWDPCASPAAGLDGSAAPSTWRAPKAPARSRKLAVQRWLVARLWRCSWPRSPGLAHALCAAPGRAPRAASPRPPPRRGDSPSEPLARPDRRRRPRTGGPRTSASPAARAAPAACAPPGPSGRRTPRQPRSGTRVFRRPPGPPPAHARARLPRADSRFELGRDRDFSRCSWPPLRLQS